MSSTLVTLRPPPAWAPRVVTSPPVPVAVLGVWGFSPPREETVKHRFTGWWFQIFLFSSLFGGMDPIWLIFFKGVENTNTDLSKAFGKRMDLDGVDPPMQMHLTVIINLLLSLKGISKTPFPAFFYRPVKAILGQPPKSLPKKKFVK